MKFLFVCAFLTFVVALNAHISIDIDAEDLDRVGEFIQNLHINREEHLYDLVHTSIRFKMMKIVKQTTFTIIQLCGFMMAMVGSNLITASLSPMQHQQQQEEQTELHVLLKNISQINGGTCNINFGCNNNVCWKTCYDDDIRNQQVWCYTSSNPKSHDYHQCDTHTDCSPCWECVEVCHP